MPALQVTVTDIAADTNVLLGTDLDTVPYSGLLQIWMASTVLTATVTISLGDIQSVRGAIIPLRTNGVPNINEDPPAFEALVDGGHPNVALGGVTGTVMTIARLTPVGEL